MNTMSERLKSKRKEKGFSQKMLANGICEQSQISKIERGQYMPAADLLYKLAKRLEVSVEYFFSQEVKTTSNLVEFKRLAEKLLEDRNYADLDYLFQLETGKNHYLSLEDQAYLTWIEAIIDFYLHYMQDRPINTLENLLHKLPSQLPICLKILNTLSNFYFVSKNEEKYEENHKLLLELYREKDLNHQEYLFGYIRVRYNFAYFLYQKGRNLEAMQEALETIEFCKQKETSYQLAPLLTIAGNAGQEFLEPSQVRDYYLQARELCKIYDHKLLLMKIEHFLKNMK